MSASAFRLGEAWPDWWAEKHIANEAVTTNDDGRWRGGPDRAVIQSPHGPITVLRGEWVVPIVTFLDAEGEETDDPQAMAVFIAGEKNQWFTARHGDFVEAPIQ